MKTGVLLLLIACASVSAHSVSNSDCGGNHPTRCNVPSYLQGNWNLTHVNCNGGNSILLSDAALASSASSSLTLGASTGQIVWNYYGCTATTPLSSVSLDGDSLTYSYQATSCSGQCQGIAACSGGTDSGSSTLSLDSLTAMRVTIGLSTIYLNPCAGTSDTAIEYSYTKTS